MTVTAIALSNAGAESGSLAGWTNYNRFTTTTGGVAPHGGTNQFVAWRDGVGGSDSLMYRDVAVPGGITAAVDAGTIAVMLKAWLQTQTDSFGQLEAGHLYMEFYDNLGAYISSHNYPNPKAYHAYGVWTEIKESCYLPTGTRTIRILARSFRIGGFGNHSYWDDFSLDYSDNVVVDWPSTAYSQQLQGYALGTEPADEAYASQLPVTVVGAAETANGQHDVNASQLTLYALVRRYQRKEFLHSFTLTQDDHDWYFLNGGKAFTLMFDFLTGQWADWRSPGYQYWRVSDAVEWKGLNVGCDSFSGILWEIDPYSRLDYGDTPITSILTGQVPVRLRQVLPVYAAELVVSEAEPSQAGVGIQLRFSDDTLSYYDMGEVVGEALGDATLFRWYGLGQAAAPGRIFEITDTGYARRIDSFDIAVGGENE